MREPWQRFEVKLERFIEAGDTVVVFVRETAQSRQGGPLMHTDVASLFRVRGQKIAEMRGYLDRDEALKILRAADQAKL
jgi:ketosteroid isomerase-like protein